jgi:hypothetical protein
MAYRGTWILASGLLAVLPGLAQAQCTSKDDASAVKKSAKLAADCNYKKLKKGPALVCKTSPPPACAGTLVTDAIALAWGANNPPAAAVDTRALRDQITCQKTISKGVVDFISKKLKYLIEGLSAADAETRARKSIDKIPRKCLAAVAQDVSQVIVPDVGPPLFVTVAMYTTMRRCPAPVSRSTPRRSRMRWSRCSRPGSTGSGRTHSPRDPTSSSSSPMTSASTPSA